MVSTKAVIYNNLKIGENYFHLTLNARSIAGTCVPGQFVEVRIADSTEPLLRRPLSIHRAGASRIEILYEAVGKGTELLSRKKTGESLDMIGPLGNGFTVQRKPKTVNILVAGGMGVAPLVFLAETLASRDVLVLIGARTKKQILCEKEFKKFGCDVKIATDDGSRGFKGRVTDLLAELLRTKHDVRSTALYACGPKPMLKAISEISKTHNIPAQISMEEHMACGIGACLGCVVKTKNGYQRVCKDGPVFDAREIVWEER